MFLYFFSSFISSKWSWINASIFHEVNANHIHHIIDEIIKIYKSLVINQIVNWIVNNIYPNINIFFLQYLSAHAHDGISNIIATKLDNNVINNAVQKLKPT